jgi:Domain of unknown function (DUF1707)
MATDDTIRASDADREHTVGILRDGYVVGRLTLDEFDERTTAAFTSRTWGELRALTQDLPGAGQRAFRPPARQEPAAQRSSEQPPPAALSRGGPGLRPVLIIALFWLTLTFTAHAAGVLIPLVFLLLVAMPSAGRRRCGSGRASHPLPDQSPRDRPTEAPDRPGPDAG